LTDVAASVTPSTLQTAVTMAVKNETSNALLREGNISVAIASVSAAISNVVSVGSSIEGNFLTVPNSLSYIKCYNLFGYAFVDGLCSKVLSDTGFLQGYPGAYYPSSSNSWQYVYTQNLDASFDGNGWSSNLATYTCSTPGYYLMTSNLAYYMDSAGSTMYFVAAQNSKLSPPTSLATGMYSALASPGYYYNMQHASGVVNLNSGDTLTYFYRTETTGMYFYMSSFSLALMAPAAQSGNVAFMAALPAPVAMSGVSTDSTPLMVKGSNFWSVTVTSSLHNVQGAFNPSTGYFTAPQAGLYFIAGTVGLMGHTGLFSLYLVKNDDYSAQDCFGSLSSNVNSKTYVGTTIDVSGVLNLAANDRVSLYYIPSTSSFTFMNNSFSAVLITPMANRPAVVATPPSGGVSVDYDFYPGYDYSMGTSCSLCYATTNAWTSSGTFITPYAATYFVDIILNGYDMSSWSYFALAYGSSWDSSSGSWFYMYVSNLYQNYHMSLTMAFQAGQTLGVYFYSETYGWTLYGSSTFTIALIAVTY